MEKWIDVLGEFTHFENKIVYHGHKIKQISQEKDSIGNQIDTYSWGISLYKDKHVSGEISADITFSEINEEANKCQFLFGYSNINGIIEYYALGIDVSRHHRSACSFLHYNGQVNNQLSLIGTKSSIKAGVTYRIVIRIIESKVMLLINDILLFSGNMLQSLTSSQIGILCQCSMEVKVENFKTNSTTPEKKDVSVLNTNAKTSSHYITNKRKVFVVHGRNERIRASMFNFLRAIGLEPIEWADAKRLTRKGTPKIDEILDAVFFQCKSSNSFDDTR